MLDTSPFTYKIYGPAMYMACHLFMLHRGTIAHDPGQSSRNRVNHVRLAIVDLIQLNVDLIQLNNASCLAAIGS